MSSLRSRHRPKQFYFSLLQLQLPFIDLLKMDQMEEVTRSQRLLWQDIHEKTVGFGHPHKIPPDNRMLQVKYLTKMHRRLTQRKSTRTFNGGRPWDSYSEMFQFDLNWNGTMSRVGWIVHNIHLLEELNDLAFTDLREYNAAGFNYFDRRKANIEVWCNVKAMEML